MRSAQLIAAVLACSAFRQARAQARPLPLDTVTVFASRTGIGDSTKTIQVITREEIDRSPARTIADVLASLPGVDVYTRSPAQGDLAIRGSTSDQVVVLVDGQRLSDVQSSHYDLDLAVPLADVERIEILRGPGAAILGPGAIGGAVNIVTRDAAPGSLSLRGGSFGVIGGTATQSVRIASVALSSAGDFEKSDGQRNGTDYRIGQARLTLSNSLGMGHLRTNVGAGIRDFGANAFYGPYDSYERTGTETVDSRWDGSLSKWTLSASGGTRRHSDDYILLRNDPALYENHHHSWQTTGELVGRTVRGPLVLALGGDGMHDQLSSARLGGRREWRSGAFAEGTFGGRSPMTVDAGARVERTSTFGTFLSPSLSLTTRLATQLRLRASGSTGFREPTWTERYYTDPVNRGDSTLHAERFRSGEIGATFDAGGFALDAAGWTRHAENLIDWVRPIGAPPTTVWQATNVGRADYDGVEANLRLPSIVGAMTSIFGTGVKFTDHQGTGLDGKYALRPISRDLGLRVARSWERTLELSAEVIAARRAHEPGHLTGDFHFAWLHRGLRASIDATNLANAVWLDASGERVAGRAAVVSIGWAGV